jgi:polysaccharide biosynthesis/export protein
MSSNKRYWIFALSLVLTTGLGNRASSDDRTGSNGTQTTTAGIQVGPDYVIGPADSLEINVWKENDLDAKVPVRPDGKISLPLLGDVTASGFTPTQLAADLSQRLKKYVDDPRVTVVVTAVNSRRIYIVGEVAHTGAYPLLGNMTVLQALSGAGGFSPFASLKNIYILRNQDGTQVKLPFNYKKVIKGENMQQNVQLRPGDTIVVP